MVPKCSENKSASEWDLINSSHQEGFIAHLLSNVHSKGCSYTKTNIRAYALLFIVDRNTCNNSDKKRYTPGSRHDLHSQNSDGQNLDFCVPGI